MSSLDHIIKFADILMRFREVERATFHRNSERNENDSEHSFSLVLLGWYINESYSLGLDTDKIIRYALVHDLVEVYAGDTYFYHTDASVHESKQEREEQAALQLRSEFPEFPQMHDLIAQYERREDEESRFVYALDKIEPVISIYLDNGRTWKKKSITIEMLTEMKRPKVAQNPKIAQIFEELILKLQDERNRLF